MTTDVLVVGAGPVGLTTAISLARRGVACRIVDRRPEPRPGTRACTVWQRTLEVFRLLGLPMDAYLAAGSRYVHRTYHVTGFPPFTHDMSEPSSTYPAALVIGQQETERVLTERLTGLGIAVERGWTAVGIEQGVSGVRTELAGQAGRRQVESAYVVAAEGPHSTIRSLLGIPFPAKHFPGTQLLQVDARVTGLPGDPAHCHMFLGERGSLGTAPLPDGRVRLYAGVVDSGLTSDPSTGELRAAVEAVTGQTGIDLSDARFAWRVRLRNSVAETFRAGRCFLAGDTAHTVMPVTAQGMNTGVQDAFNLGWKLAEAVQGRAGEVLLDSYHAERHPVALALVAHTERAYWGGAGPVPDFARIYERLHHISSAHTGIPLSYRDHGNAVPGLAAGDRAPDGPVHTVRVMSVVPSRY